MPVSKKIDKVKTCSTIKERCLQSGLKAEELAEQMDVSVQTIYSWYSMKKLPSISHLVELADILNVSVDELIQTVDEESAETKTEKRT
jgi:transcriptional regulator with XRE-family HTH domain